MLSIARFELRNRLKLISTYIYFLLFFALGVFLMLTATGTFAGASVSFGGGRVLANSPYALHEYLTLVSYLGVIVTAAMMGRAVQQDFEYEVHPFFFTAPISKFQYLGGRFLGALGAMLFVFSGIALGALLATKLPWGEPYRLGPNLVRAYLQPYLVGILPNLLFTGAVFFGLAALTRKMFGVYLAGVALFAGYLVAGALVSDLEYRTTVALLDPFGSFATDEITRYWTIAEKNERFVPLTGVLLWNRLLWTAAGLGLFALCYARFSFAHVSGGGGAKKRKLSDPAETGSAPAPVVVAARAIPHFSLGGYFGMLPHLTRLAFRETVRNPYFAAIALCAVLFALANATAVGKMYGTETFPVTYQVLEFVGGLFSLFVLILIAVYSGELVWREREARLHQISDALPIPTWLPYLAKLLALIGVQVLLLALLMLCGILTQVFKGYFHFELGLYAKELFGLRLFDYALLCVLAFTVHAVVNQKYLGHFVMVLFFAVKAFSNSMGFEHPLYKYGSRPPTPYSDMNGFGHFLEGALWFDLYWALAAVLLALVANLLWVRGTDGGARARLKIALSRFTLPVRVAGAAALVGFVALAAFIFHNTVRLNRHITDADQEALLATYERKYKALEADAQPRVISSRVEVDLFPETRRADLRGSLGLRNKTDRPVERLHVFVDPKAKVRRMAPAAGGELVHTDEDLGLRTFQLATPLLPGAETALEYELEYRNEGFARDGGDRRLVHNGTFIDSSRLPSIGYAPDHELSDERARKKHGLPPRPRMPALGDPAGLTRNYISHDGDWITFEATVSTSPDQIALAPGYLQREWMENGRRYFHYKMDAPILNFYAFLSARYTVAKGQWGDVPIEVYYHAPHDWNVQGMIDGSKASLEYLSEAFGPYQHRQVRILEFPRYMTFAQSFPNTIPYSEAVGFIARVRPDSEKDVDYPYYITAHEVAHQWWGHQVVGAYMQGATVMVETLAQYSSLMVMKRKYGEAMMGRFLRYELDRYLIGRSTERERELPLLRVENQGYIHYNKGSLVMYLLQDLVGEQVVNAALRRFRDRAAYQGPPYPTAQQLVDELRTSLPPEYQYLVKDLFEEITLYENRAVKAVATKREDGKYEIALTTFARKMRADPEGRESEVPMEDFVEVGLVDEKGKALAVERKQLGPGEQTFTLVSDTLPAKAGIDPLFKLIDRQPSDNLVAVVSP